MDQQEIRNKLAEMNFHHGQVNSVYLPLTLTCHAIGAGEPLPDSLLCDDEVTLTLPTSKKVIGKGKNGCKEYKDGEVYRLQCMFGKDGDAERVLFCREEGENETSKIIRGFFLFEFDAEQFFQLLQNASYYNWERFILRIHRDFVRSEEVAKFSEMVGNARQNLSQKKMERAESLIQSLMLEEMIKDL